jgi:hypothetical protein
MDARGASHWQSLLAILIVPEETGEPTGDLGRPPFTAAVVKEDEACRNLRTRRIGCKKTHTEETEASSPVSVLGLR